MAAVVGKEDKLPFAILIIAEPMTRLTEAQMLGLGPALLETTEELALISCILPALRDQRDATLRGNECDRARSHLSLASHPKPGDDHRTSDHPTRRTGRHRHRPTLE